MKEGDGNVNFSSDEMDILPRTVYSERNKERLPRAKKAMCSMIRRLGKGFKELIYDDFMNSKTVEHTNKLKCAYGVHECHQKEVLVNMENRVLSMKFGAPKGRARRERMCTSRKVPV